MTLDESIAELKRIASSEAIQAREHPEMLGYVERFYDREECAERCAQLADWLTELKAFRAHAEPAVLADTAKTLKTEI